MLTRPPNRTRRARRRGDPRPAQAPRAGRLARRAALLAKTAGLVVVGRLTQRLETPHPATLMGKGKLAELKLLVTELGANVVVFDDELSPASSASWRRSWARRSRSSTARPSSSTSSPATPAPARAPCRWSWPNTSIACRASPAPGPTWPARPAVVPAAPPAAWASAAPARPSWKSTAARSTGAFRS